MSSFAETAFARDKLLFTPGPLTTSARVKQAMLRDPGSWDLEFNELVSQLRGALLALAGVTRESGWEVIPMQGSGTFGVESVFQSCVPASGKVAVLANGAYGERMAQMLRHAQIPHVLLRTPEDIPNDADALESMLRKDESVTHVAAVHCETTTGILNPIQALGRVAKAHGKTFIVDAMSSFVGLPIDLEACQIDFLISSANKCIEGVPGFSFVFCRRAILLASEGTARCLSLDLLDQLRGFEKDGKFRYTPPTQSLLAFQQALQELEDEGGIAGRHARYVRNHELLQAGMRGLGFKCFLPAEVQSPIITAYHYPEGPRFDFALFYRELSRRAFLIYPGKLTRADTFRIATIGRIFPHDIEQLLWAMESLMKEHFAA